MQWQVRIKEDCDKTVDLIFGTEESADNFLKFVNIYYGDCGVSGDLWGYWPHQLPIHKKRVIWPQYFDAKKEILNENFIHLMLHQILEARLAERVDEINPKEYLNFGAGEKGFFFKFKKCLPSRLCPAVGDCCRIVRSLYQECDLHEINEGIVVKDCGTFFEIVPYGRISKVNSKTERRFLPKVKTLLIEPTKTMKILDWAEGKLRSALVDGKPGLVRME